MGTMSKDRVEFDFPLSPYREEPLRKAFRMAFGCEPPRAQGQRYGEPFPIAARIRCRPSQFARFLIYRNEAGCTNGFKCLNPKLVPAPAPVAQPLDVSGNAAGC